MQLQAAGAVLLVGLACAGPARAALTADELGVVYRAGDARSEALARDYQTRRGVPAGNVVGLNVPTSAAISPAALAVLRQSAARLLPERVHALLLVWTRPYAVGCMSITTAFAAGYRPAFCEPGCGRTELSPLYDAESLESARKLDWRPTMLLPTEDAGVTRAVVDHGLAADATRPRGIVYLVDTGDVARNVRAVDFPNVVRVYGQRLTVRRIQDSDSAPLASVLAYFTGVARVSHLSALSFRPGAVADHLTSAGGFLDGTDQTTVLAWLRAGATASYGTVTEPCNHVGKFPSPMVFLGHYLRGETLIEAYWKSVAMPGQGLFVGEPLAQPYAAGAR